MQLNLIKKQLARIIVVCLISNPLQAGLLDLSDTPLFLGTSVNPNVFFEIDDSGSMDWEFLTPPHWHFCSYDSNATGSFSADTTCGWLVENGLVRSYSGGYRYFTYLYQNSDNAYSDGCTASERNSIEACTAAGDKEWRTYSSDLNRIYYNPSTVYTPWQGPCLTSNTNCSQASFTAAKSNPREAETGYSQTKDLAGSQYHIWIDDKGYNSADGRPLRSASINYNATPNNEVDLWDTHIKVTLNSGNATISHITYNPDATGMNTTETLQATLSNSTACYNALGPKSLVESIVSGLLAYDSTSSVGCKTIAEAKNNFANWYEYARRRSFVAKSAVSSVISDYPHFRYGLSVINNYSTLFTEVPASSISDTSSHNTQLLSNLYSFNWPALGTPLRKGLERAGQYYDGVLSGKTDPIVHSCQQNFTILLTDGFWNGYNPSSSIGDADGDGNSITVADVAKYYYDKDLSSLPNQVITNPFDSATHQHMVTFTVAFGVSGNLTDTSGDGWPNPVLSENSNWGNPFSGDPEKIDDLWHAAFNSKGKYVAAQTPEQVSAQLGQTLANISDRVSSAAMVAQNSTVLNTSSQIYQAKFDSNDWHGELLAYGIDAQGSISNTPNWNAGCLLTGGVCQLPAMLASQNPGKLPTNRVIITKDVNSNLGTAFRWPSDYSVLKVSGVYPDHITNFMSYSPYSINTSDPTEKAANQIYGDKLLEYIRGTRTEEQQNGGSQSFRNRSSILGDIVHSDPLYVGPPSRYYSDTFETQAYSTFKQTYANRTALVYSGSNDGMLHGFNAITGEELISYIPANRNVYQNLAELSIPGYQHNYSLDGSPVEADVFYNNAWHSILVSGLRSGGQSVFALDITNPANFTEANANNILLWEFNDTHDADLGYSFSNVVIAKVRNGVNSTKWAVIFGNGFNNSEADGYASTTGKAALYVLFIENGLDGTWVVDTDYIKIPVGSADVVTPNGLSGIYPVDINGDYIVDYIYAGDIKGNLWRFDLQDTTPTNWKNNAFKLFQTQDATLGDQAITTPPIVNTHPLGIAQGVLVYFGTGKYLEPSDNDNISQPTQSFYAIWDKFNATPVTKNDLLQQSILGEYTVNLDLDGDGLIDETTELRDVSQNAINWTTPVQVSDPPQHLGWYLDLFVTGNSSNDGERQISRALLRNGNIIFTTMLPSISPCEFGGESWIMELNAENGGKPNVTPFDINQDGIFDVLDYINLGDTNGDGVDETTPPSGQKSKVGIAPTPAVFLSADKETETKVMSGSRGLDTFTENPEPGPSGRQTWRQIK
jgi:type IV pilus assembly protein PilY1